MDGLRDEAEGPAGGEDGERDQPSDEAEGEEVGEEQDEGVEGEGSDCNGGQGSGREPPDDDNNWEEIYACPLAVRFTQDKIHPFFYRRGPIINVVPKIRAVLPRSGAEGNDIVELVPPFSPIHCLRKGSELWSLDNRRLYALQLAAMERWPRRCRVRLLCRDRLPRHKFKTQYRKFNTTSAGQAIDVCAKYQQFDTWSWFERAVELEWCSLSARLGGLFSAFEVVPVVGALLFRTGLTGFRSRAPLIAAFVLAFALDLLRQKVPALERGLSQLHVRAVVQGEASADGGRGEEQPPSSAVQRAALMALLLLLLLPYLLGLAFEKLRSSLLSCWLGVACVLAAQIAPALREGRRLGTAAAAAAHTLSPKHRL